MKLPGRRLFRLTRFLTRCARAGWDGPHSEGPAQANWALRHGKGFARAMGLKVEVDGDPGNSQAWVGNHLGYMDIVGLSTVRPVAFVAKSEIRAWPMIGKLAAKGGTIFIERSRRMAVGEVTASMAARVKQGVPVVFFPEGTSSAGESVLPFHASLFGPAVDQEWMVTPFALAFDCRGPDGVDVPYWGEMSFGPHFLKLMTHHSIRMRVKFGAPARMSGDRKVVAREWRDRVSSLHSDLRAARGR